MGVDINFQLNKSISLITHEVTGGDKTLLFAAKTWQKLYDDFVPMDTGTLAHDAVDIYIEDGKAVVHHKTPYADRQYFGEGFNFSHEKHPLASSKWDETAKQAGKTKILVNTVQAFLNK